MAKRFDASSMELPEQINRAAWVDWCEDRKERGKPLTSRAATMAINRLLPFTKEEQWQAVQTSIECSWSGLFPKKIHDSRDAWIDRITDKSWAKGLH